MTDNEVRQLILDIIHDICSGRGFSPTSSPTFVFVSSSIGLDGLPRHRDGAA